MTDQSRPSAPLRVVEGREEDAREASAAIDTLVRITRSASVRKEIERALIAAGIVEVDRG